MSDELTFKEKVIEAAIRTWATVASWWTDLLRPGTAIAAGIIVASGVMALLKAQDVPDLQTWERGSAANTALTIVTAAAMVLTFLMALGYRQLLSE